MLLKPKTVYFAPDRHLSCGDRDIVHFMGTGISLEIDLFGGHSWIPIKLNQLPTQLSYELSWVQKYISPSECNIWLHISICNYVLKRESQVLTYICTARWRSKDPVESNMVFITQLIAKCRCLLLYSLVEVFIRCRIECLQVILKSSYVYLLGVGPRLDTYRRQRSWTHSN